MLPADQEEDCDNIGTTETVKIDEPQDGPEEVCFFYVFFGGWTSLRVCAVIGALPHLEHARYTLDGRPWANFAPLIS